MVSKQAMIGPLRAAPRQRNPKNRHISGAYICIKQYEGGSHLPRILSSFALFVLLVASNSMTATSVGRFAQAKPIKEQPIYVEFNGPPSSLNEAILSVEVVLRGRVVGSGPRDKAAPRGGRGMWIRTGHRVKVLEVFRAPTSLDLTDAEITVVQRGGDRDRGSYVGRTIVPGFPLLGSGNEYVLFLARADTDWTPAYGPDGVFENAGERVRPLGMSQMATRQKDLPWAEFVQLLRNFGVGAAHDFR